MSDPQRAPGATPPRADPLQPDRPGAGRGRQDEDDGDSAKESLDKAKEQERTAGENTRRDY